MALKYEDLDVKYDLLYVERTANHLHVCRQCGAVVADTALHDEWHNAMARRIRNALMGWRQ